MFFLNWFNILYSYSYNLFLNGKKIDLQPEHNGDKQNLVTQQFFSVACCREHLISVDQILQHMWA